MNAVERKAWHQSENHVMVERDSLDWKRAEKYQTEHFKHYKEPIFIKEVWRDADNFLCVQYVNDTKKMINWFHYTVNNGELEWW